MQKQNLPNLSLDSLTTEVLAILLCDLKAAAPVNPVVDMAWDTLFNVLTERVGSGMEDLWLAAADEALTLMNTNLQLDLIEASRWRREAAARLFAELR